MKQGALETIIGFIVIIIAAIFFMYAYKTSNSAKDKDGYVLNAYFQNIEGLTEGSDVKLSGIKIGYVDSITLQNDTFFAQVKLRIGKNIEIPNDSRAIVAANGLLGGNYIRINPGSSDDSLAANEKIKFTQSAMNLEDLISKVVYSMTSKS